jgi:hypothetical protein
MKLPKIGRRGFLQGAGVTLALPWLDALAPRVRGTEPAPPPPRFFAVCTTLGFHAPFLFPNTPGREYESTPYLDLLQEHREDFTVFSGVSHPEVDGGHYSEASFLTAAPHPKASTFKNTISLDQYMVEQAAPETRIPSLTLSTLGGTLSWTSRGVSIPAETSPAAVFKRLFVNGTKQEVDEQVHKLRVGKSVLDAVLGQAGKMYQGLDSSDREKLDQYMTAVRDVEGRLQDAEAWIHRPKPKVDVEPPVDIDNHSDLIGRTKLMIDVVQLAFATDSTRIATLNMDTVGAGLPIVPGVTMGHHNLSHHGLDPTKIAQLRLIEEAELKTFGYLLKKFGDAKEHGTRLLDRTHIVFGSNLGNASSHDTHNMPMFSAGGGFRHGQHLAFDRENNYPLCNLYVSILQKMGIESDRFGSSTGTFRGLEPV